MRNLFAALLLMTAPAVVSAQSPTDVIREASDLLSAQLEERRDEFAADEAALHTMVNEIILPRFNREYAARLVLGRNWRNASEQQRADFVDAFYNNLLRRYAEGVLEFNQDRIEILPLREAETNRIVIVKTLVTLDDGTKVPVDYGMSNRDGPWMVFDVIIEGISYVRNFRAELNSEIRNSSLDAVIERLRRETGTAGSAE